jgi:hypothetical protein
MSSRPVVADSSVRNISDGDKLSPAAASRISKTFSSCYLKTHRGLIAACFAYFVRGSGIWLDLLLPQPPRWCARRWRRYLSAAQSEVSLSTLHVRAKTSSPRMLYYATNSLSLFATLSAPSCGPLIGSSSSVLQQ